MDFSKELGVKGYCFRGYKDNPTVAAKVKACGLDRIDLSGVQLNFRDPTQHEPAIRAYREAGVTIVGIGAVPLNGDASDKELFAFCRKAGCSTISIMGAPETFFEAVAAAERWADEYDVRLAIHNHGGKHWLGNSQMLKHVLGRTSARVGLCLDTAWCIQAGENPVSWLKLFAGRVYAVHFKDFVFDAKGAFRDVVVGEGALDLPAFVSGLQATGFEGPAVIEYEADVENPVPALTRCVASMRRVFATAQAGEPHA